VGSLKKSEFHYLKARNSTFFKPEGEAFFPHIGGHFQGNHNRGISILLVSFDQSVET
jgi:hypothetical protein